jgi:D-arabinose 1-dehydrogenase-like Zn-dependent alcohol dehydrogenase
MSDSQGMAIRRQRHADGTVTFADASCGACEECSAGVRLWCTNPCDEPARVGAAVPGEYADLIESALLSVAALVALRPLDRHETVLATGASAGAAAVFARKITGAAVLTASDPRDEDVRRQLADQDSSGRASVIVATDHLRDAVRAVRRGGYVCGAPNTDLLPSVTELVQREVSLIGPQDITELCQELSPDDWTSALAALGQKAA